MIPGDLPPASMRTSVSPRSIRMASPWPTSMKWTVSSPCAGTGFGVVSIGDTSVVGPGDTGIEVGGEAVTVGDVVEGIWVRISVGDETGLVARGSGCWGVEQQSRTVMRIRRVMRMGSLFMGVIKY